MSGLPPLPVKWVFDANRDPPVYSRPLVGSELFMQRFWNAFDADGEACLGFNFTSSLRIEELKHRAREALDKLRFVCPIIACTVEDVVSPRWVYTPSADREAWLDLALVVEERGVSLNSSEFVQSINLKRLPYTDRNGTTTLLRAYLLTTSKDGNNDGKEYGLYFHGSHIIIDFRPTLHALNLMCEWISDEGLDVRIKPSEEWKNLPVDPITATGRPYKEWETAGTRLLQDFAEQHTRTTPCHTLAPPSRPLNMSDPPFRYIISVSEAKTAAIVTQTRKLGVTVSTLFLAAHCLAQFKMNPIPGNEVDFSTDSAIVSLEPYMKPPVNPRTHFVSSFTLMPLRFSMARPLMEHNERGRLIMTIKILQERFDRYLADPCLPHLLAAIESMMPLRVKQDDKTASELAGKARAEDVPMPRWACIFENLGVVEKRLGTQHGKVVVGDIYSGNRLRTFMTTHMWTMHSRFQFQVQGNTAWGEECMKTLLEETVRIGFLITKTAKL